MDLNEAQEAIRKLGYNIPSESDPYGRKPKDPGAKLDQGKPRTWLCIQGFSRALGKVAEVTTVGAEKYSPRGWEFVPNGAERYMDAAMRHLLAHGRGEEVDQDTGCLHLAQATWNLLAAMELRLRSGDGLANHT